MIATTFFLLLYFNHISIKELNPLSFQHFSTMVLIVFIALEEELFFRVLILEKILQDYNRYTAILISAIIFALFHSVAINFQWVALINLLLGGTLLGLLYVSHRSIGQVWAFHFGWNISQTILGFNVSGNNLPSVVVISYNGPLVLTGGTFGLEASMLTCLWLLIAIIIIVKKYSGNLRT